MNDIDNWQKVIPVIDKRMPGFCKKPYYNHKKGCPNWNKKAGCPPNVIKFEDLFDMDREFYAIYYKFDLKYHVTRMRIIHPKWTDRQLYCCLYWQGTARKQLKEQVKLFAYKNADLINNGLIISDCPEAQGVNITATMLNIGIELEWPPIDYVYKVVIAGNIKGANNE